MANMRELETLTTALTARGLSLSPEVAKAIAAHDLIQRTATDNDLDLGKPVRDLTREEMREALTLHAVRAELANGLGQGAMRLQATLFAEAVAVMTDEVPTILKALRPAFNKAATAVAVAVKAGIEPGMTAEDVIDLDANAIESWRALPAHLKTLSDIAALRVALSEVLGIGPAITQGAIALGERVDYTACFTRPDVGVTFGYASNSPHRWLSLSRATGGRLRLNESRRPTSSFTARATAPGGSSVAPAPSSETTTVATSNSTRATGSRRGSTPNSSTGSSTPGSSPPHDPKPPDPQTATPPAPTTRVHAK